MRSDPNGCRVADENIIFSVGPSSVGASSVSSSNFSWDLLRDLLPAAFAIAMLGAIESLLCAVVLDGMSGKRHSAKSELLGQRIGNIGGITAIAAIARSAANFKAGAQSPVAAVKQIAEMTRVVEITGNRDYPLDTLPASCRAFKITGPLFSEPALNL